MTSGRADPSSRGPDHRDITETDDCCTTGCPTSPQTDSDVLLTPGVTRRVHASPPALSHEVDVTLVQFRHISPCLDRGNAAPGVYVMIKY